MFIRVLFICCIKANLSVPDSSNRTYLDILKLDEGSIFHLRREALAFAEILERWRLPVIRKLFLKGFARKMIIQNEESNSQKKKTKQLDKFFGEKAILIISKMTIFLGDEFEGKPDECGCEPYTCPIHGIPNQLLHKCISGKFDCVICRYMRTLSLGSHLFFL